MSISEINISENSFVDPNFIPQTNNLVYGFQRSRYTKVTENKNLLKGLAWSIGACAIPFIGLMLIITIREPSRPGNKIHPLVQAIGIGAAMSVYIPTVILGLVITIQTSLNLVRICFNNAKHSFAKSSFSLIN